MGFIIPVELRDYNGRSTNAAMGPFEHSPEREFALTVNRRAIDECTSLEQLKPVTKNLLEGWSSMNTAMQKMILENIQLRQALSMREMDLKAAEDMLNEAAGIVQKCSQKSNHARRRLWPW